MLITPSVKTILSDDITDLTKAIRTEVFTAYCFSLIEFCYNGHLYIYLKHY